MKIAGIIAEYNPFHRGHAYHLSKTKGITGAEAVVVVMSGDFTQRGGPAAHFYRLIAEEKTGIRLPDEYRSLPVIYENTD